MANIEYSNFDCHLNQPVQKSDYVKWNNSLSTGIKLIDDQHRGLIDFVNDLFRHANKNEDDEHAYFKKVIGQAVNYIKIHFATEEKIMLITKFPGYKEHKKAHEEFTQKLINTVKDFEAGKRLVLFNFSNFLKDWILSHISIIDAEYKIFLKKNAAHKPDEN